MMRALLWLACLLPMSAVAAPWTFTDPIMVAGADGPPHFHHLDGAGRRHIAASATEVALVWEDDRSGAPQVYMAVKPLAARSFERRHQLSGGEEAYEPAIVALDDGRWAAAWEQDGSVMARVIDAAGPGPLRQLAANARQVTLAAGRDGRLAAVWAQGRDGGQLIEAAELSIDDTALAAPTVPTVVAPVDEDPVQGYPAAAWSNEGLLLVAWEDRRAGHTRLFHSWREPGQPFASERQLNEHEAPSARNGEDIRLGSGVMRVMLAVDADDTVRTIWLDKRNAASGYAVWGAASRDGGRTFGRNEIVQDDLGAAVAQWHASLAGGQPGFVAVWDDAREGWADPNETGDVLLSWHDGDAWSSDLVVPGASGDGYQGSPAVTFDANGGLHLVWIERDTLSSPTRLRYMHGVSVPP
jgi:hypothetical protein